MEATQLSQQLKKLQAPQTDLFSEKRLRPSIIFSAKEAVNCNRETFYRIGVSGLGELVEINSKFKRFKENLFGIHTKDTQRTLMDRKSNDELNIVIEEFLLLLSPYLEKQCALKALEWLIYRFLVNEMNVNSLMGCILPYFETVIFTRVLQVITAQALSDRWQWLVKAQQNGHPLTKSMVFNQWASYTAFRNYVADLLKKSMKIHKKKSSAKLCISFSIATVLGGLNVTNKITEEHVSSLIEVISYGLSSSNKELLKGAFFTISALAVKTRLTTDIVEHLLTKMIQNKDSEIQELKILSILVVCQTQEVNNFSVKLIETIADNPDLVTGVAELSRAKQVHSFFASYVSGCIRWLASKDCSLEKTSEKQEKLQEILSLMQCSPFSSDDSFKIIESFLHSIHGNLSVYKKEKKWKMSIADMLRVLEQSHPEGYDRAIANLALDSKKMSDFEKHLFDSENFAMGGDSMFRSLNHSETNSRLAAVKSFKKKIQNKQIIDPMIIQTNLRNILQDESPEIVLQILSLKNNLLNHLPAKELFVVGASLIEKSKQGHSWDLVQQSAFQLLLDVLYKNYDNNQNLEVVLICLRHVLFPKGLLESIPKIILVSSFSLHNPILSSLYTHLAPLLGEESIKSSELMKQCWKSLPSVFLNIPLDYKCQLSEYISASIGSKDVHSHFISMLILLLLVQSEKGNNLTLSYKLIDTCLYSQTMFRTVCESEEEDDDIKQGKRWLKSAMKGYMAMSFLAKCIEAVAKSITELPNWLSVSPYWSFMNIKTEFAEENSLLLLLKALKCAVMLAVTDGYEKHQVPIIRIIFKDKLKETKPKLYLLSMIWSWQEFLPYSDVIDDNLQNWCLKFAASLIDSHASKLSWIMSITESVIPSLITAVCFGKLKIRKQAMKCFQSLSLVVEGKELSQNLAVVVNGIVAQSKELITDANHLPILMLRLYEVSKSCVKSILQIITNATTPNHIKSSLLFAISEIHSTNILKSLLPLATNFIDHLTSLSKLEGQPCHDPAASMCLHYIFLKFTPETASILDISEGWQLFLKATNCTDDVMWVNDLEISPQNVILDQVVDHKFFLSLKKVEVQAELWMILVHRIAVSENVKEAVQLRKALRKVSLSASLIISQVEKLDLIIDSKTTKQARARQIELRKGNGSEKVLAWRKLGLILELVTVMTNLEAPWMLVGPLCQCLRSSYVYESNITDMIQQQILSALYHLVEQSLQQLPQDSYNKINLSIENVIQCIRASLSPDTHRRALLVLSLGAKLYPDEVLTNMMAIFTFMGTSLLRRDDSYSFQVIHQTIESIVPTLIKSKTKDNRKLTEKLAEVTQVFVDALPDLPEHRKLSLFKQLANTLGVRDNLWVISTLLVYSYVSKGSLPDMDTAEYRQKVPKNIGFAVNLANQFSIIDEVQLCSHVITYLKSLPIQKVFEDDMDAFLQVKGTEQIIKWHIHSPKQFRHFLCTSVGVLIHLLSSPKFVDFAENANEDDLAELQALYESILENVLYILDIVSKLSSKSQDENEDKFWVIFQKRLIEFVEKVNALLPPSLFIMVIERLMKSSQSLVKCRAMEMLCSKMQSTVRYFNDSHHDILLPLLPNLKVIAFSNNEAAENRQTSLFAIQLLVRTLTSHITVDTLLSLLVSSCQVLSQSLTSSKVISQCILVAAETVIVLKANAIVHLPQLLPPLFKFMETKPISDDKSSEYLILTTLTAVHKILETVSKFLGKSTVNLIYSVCILSSHQEQHKFKESRINLRITSICDLLATSIEPRVLITYLGKTYEKLVDTTTSSLPTFLLLIQNMINVTDNHVLSQYQSGIVNLLTQVMALRARKVNHAEVEKIEDITNETFTKLLLKLNEVENAQLFENLHRWSKDDSANEPLRLITFYRFANHLAITYKTLFIKAKLANELFSHACLMLERNNSLNYRENVFGNDEESEEYTCILLNHILQTLTTIFIYDSVNFTTQERFSMLLYPLVNQLENMIGSEAAYKERLLKYLRPCIVKLTIASANDFLWKDLNRQILLKVRNDDNPKIILAALEVFQGLVEELGEDYLQPLLADVMPYITEVIESLDSDVEAKTREVFLKMEEILGDDLRAYLTS